MYTNVWTCFECACLAHKTVRPQREWRRCSCGSEDELEEGTTIPKAREKGEKPTGLEEKQVFKTYKYWKVVHLNNRREGTYSDRYLFIKDTIQSTSFKKKRKLYARNVDTTPITVPVHLAVLPTHIMVSIIKKFSYSSLLVCLPHNHSVSLPIGAGTSNWETMYLQPSVLYVAKSLWSNERNLLRVLGIIKFMFTSMGVLRPHNQLSITCLVLVTHAGPNPEYATCRMELYPSG